MRLAPIEVAPGVDFLLQVRAASGPGFTVGAGPPRKGPLPLRVRVSPRGNEEAALILLPPVAAGERLQVRFYLKSDLDLEITGLELRALSPAHRAVPTLVVFLGPLALLGFGIRNRTRLLAYVARGQDAERSLDRLVATLLILVLFLVFQQAPVIQTVDAKYLTAVSHSLLTRGSLDLPPELAAARGDPPPYQFVTRNDRTFHFFAAAPAILNAPIVYAFERAGISSVAPDGRFFRRREIRIFRVAAAAVAAALCGVLFLLARLWLRPGPALVLTLVFAFGSQIFSTISRPFWSHSWASLLLAAGLYPLLAPRFAERRWAYVASASLLSWSFFCRPTMALAVLGAAGLVLATRRRFIWPLAASGMAWLGLFMAHTYVERGEWLPGYFLSSHVDSGRILSATVGSSYLEAVLGTMVSPGRGQLVYVPITLGILFVVGRYWRRLPSRPLAITALAVMIAHWQLVSNFGNWWGGHSFGPRLFSDIVVWLFLLAVLGAAALGWGSGARRPAARPLLATALLLLAMASVFINTRGATDPATMRWDSPRRVRTRQQGGEGAFFKQRELWDWRHPQFLAGL